MLFSPPIEHVHIAFKSVGLMATPSVQRILFVAKERAQQELEGQNMVGSSSHKHVFECNGASFDSTYIYDMAKFWSGGQSRVAP